jgi:hypothetical protein
MSSLKESPVKTLAVLMSGKQEPISSKQEERLTPCGQVGETTQWLRTAHQWFLLPFVVTEEMHLSGRSHPVIFYKLLERNGFEKS